MKEAPELADAHWFIYAATSSWRCDLMQLQTSSHCASLNSRESRSFLIRSSCLTVTVSTISLTRRHISIRRPHASPFGGMRNSSNPLDLLCDPLPFDLRVSTTSGCFASVEARLVLLRDSSMSRVIVVDMDEELYRNRSCRTANLATHFSYFGRVAVDGS